MVPWASILELVSLDVQLALSTWHHTQIISQLDRRYAVMHSDEKWQLVSDILKVYTIYDDPHSFKTQHFTSSSKATHYSSSVCLKNVQLQNVNSWSNLSHVL